MYDKVKVVVADLLQKQAYVSCTTDIWSSLAHDSPLSLTAHIVTEDFESVQVCLQAVKFNESHTGSNIASMINSCTLFPRIEAQASISYPGLLVVGQK